MYKKTKQKKPGAWKHVGVGFFLLKSYVEQNDIIKELYMHACMYVGM